jgi:hypothetical protein
VDRDDLPVSTGNHLVTHGETRQQYAGVFGTIELAHNVAVLLHDLDRMRKLEHSTAVFRVELMPILKLAEQRLKA